MAVFYGLTEIYGPGIAIDCYQHTGLHYWNDHFVFEVIDPLSGNQVPDGYRGELVITTLTKEGMPLLRFRTRDITRIIPNHCSCGSPYPMIDRIVGRTDDMLKVKGVQLYPADIDEIIKPVPELGSEYRIIIEKIAGRDNVCVQVEKVGQSQVTNKAIETMCSNIIREKLGIEMEFEVCDHGSLPRSEKKTERVLDKRNND